MSSYSADRGRPADPLRLVALTAVIAGVVLLAAAAFVLSYSGIHQLALRAAVTPELARLYPVIFDAMLVVAGAAALALRGAGWWARCYAWLSLLILLVAVAVGDAIHATHVVLPIEPTRVVAAVIPWVFLLAAFGLWLTMLRHFRRVRTANGQAGRAAAARDAALTGQAANGTASAGAGNGDVGGPAQRAAVTWAAAGGAAAGRAPQAPTGLDLLLGPREGDPPAMPEPRQEDGAAAQEHPGQAAWHNGDHHPESVAYGEETGYVHPDSYRDHEDHGGSGPDGQAGTGQEAPARPDGPDHPGHEDEPGQDHPDAKAAAPAADATPADPDAPPADADAAPADPDAPPADADAAPADADAAPADADAAPADGDGAPADGNAAEGAPSAAADDGDAAAGAETDADGQAGDHEAKQPQPAAEATAQAAPAKSQDPPTRDGGAGDGSGGTRPRAQPHVMAPSPDAPKPPARAVMPLLERLRSTPAPPGE